MNDRSLQWRTAGNRMRGAVFALLACLSWSGSAAAQFVLGVNGSTREVNGVTVLSTNAGWPDSCTPQRWQVVRTGNVFNLYVEPPILPPGILCLSAFMGWAAETPLGVLPSEPFTINIYNWCCSGPPLLSQTLQILPSGIAPTAAQSIPTMGKFGAALLIAALFAVVAIRLRKRTLSG